MNDSSVDYILIMQSLLLVCLSGPHFYLSLLLFLSFLQEFLFGVDISYHLGFYIVLKTEIH